MANRASVSSGLFNRFKPKVDNFLLNPVTKGVIWVHNYAPENKVQSRQWVGSDSPRPKKSSASCNCICPLQYTRKQTSKLIVGRPNIKFKTQSSAGKVMITVFLGGRQTSNSI